MSVIQGYSRQLGAAGARNHIFVVPSVVCSALLARKIAEASGAIAVSHQHGCGHIGADIRQTQALFVGLAANPNVAQALVVSLGCETVQGNAVARRLNELGYDAGFVGIQQMGGNAPALEAGIDQARAMRERADSVPRGDVGIEDLVVGLAVSRPDERIPALLAQIVGTGARVVLAAEPGDVSSWLASVWPADVQQIGIGAEPAGPVSMIVDAGSGATQLLGAAASCRAQVLVQFADPDSPPLGFPLVPVLSVAAGSGLHTLINDEFDLDARVDVPSIWARILDVFSGEESAAERRKMSNFAVPRLMRTM